MRYSDENIMRPLWAIGNCFVCENREILRLGIDDLVPQKWSARKYVSVVSQFLRDRKEDFDFGNNLYLYIVPFLGSEKAGFLNSLLSS